MRYWIDIKIALRAIRGNLLRSSLTILIIAFGIMALVGILTSIDGIKAYIISDFSYMGANTFNIQNRSMRIHAGERQRFRNISYREAKEFQKRYKVPAAVSIHTEATSQARVKHRSNETNPNIEVKGTNRDYLETAGLSLAQGRNFSSHELKYGSNGAIIGNSLKESLFNRTDSVIGATIMVGSRPYEVIGVLKEKGVSGVFSPDDVVLLPLQNVRSHYSTSRLSFTISVAVNKVQLLETAIAEAKGLFRNIRNVKLGEPDNFQIVKSTSLANSLIENLKFVSLAAKIIGFVTLLGATIGLMNILLVAVSERTREIGLCKAIGANNWTIRRQFLIESILICQMGGVLGIILGILAANGVMTLLSAQLLIPWYWMGMGVTICFIVGISAGIYPAVKAARLDPIEALRYE